MELLCLAFNFYRLKRKFALNDVVSSPEDPWEHDRLGYGEIGHAFTNLVQSVETDKVISIEAGLATCCKS